MSSETTTHLIAVWGDQFNSVSAKLAIQFVGVIVRADTISALEWPAITMLVRSSAIGTMDRAAWRFRHSAPLTFGFQYSGESNAAIQLLSTIQTYPFFPRTAVS